MKTLTIKVNSIGKISVDAEGFLGTSCEEATKLVTSGLGKFKTQTKKAEYHRTDGSTAQRDLNKLRL